MCRQFPILTLTRWSMCFEKKKTFPNDCRKPACFIYNYHIWVYAKFYDCKLIIFFKCTHILQETFMVLKRIKSCFMDIWNINEYNGLCTISCILKINGLLWSATRRDADNSRATWTGSFLYSIRSTRQKDWINRSRAKPTGPRSKAKPTGSWDERRSRSGLTRFF